MKKIFFTLNLLFVCGFTQAQHFKCGIQEKQNALFEKDPQLLIDHENLLRRSMEVKEKSGSKSLIFTVPIVFHILHYNGIENISDEQVLDAVRIINEDFRALNADTNLIIPQFKSIYDDAGIEFRLASKDPAGNCTNGINRIFTHETFNGDDYSKLQQWHRSNYLNVWVVNSMENGVAGYAYYPVSTNGFNFFRDGIMIRHNYIGSIGTGNATNSRALTHEIGHYLGLAHPWGNTNNPGVSCGDDGIPDTPVTRGATTCNLSLSLCTPGVIENVQNFMDYSYCSRMFTKDQVTAMRNILQDISGNRDQLLTTETQNRTGINMEEAPLCPPKAYFYPSRRMVCVGESVQLFDRSFNGAVSSREWIVSDGNLSSATISNPTITFATPGHKSIRLRVSNDSGTDELFEERSIYVSPDWADFTGPTSFSLDENLNHTFIVLNPSTNNGQFESVNGVGVNGSTAFRLQNFRNIEGATQFSPLFFYNDRLGGSIDDLVTPSFDLSNTSNVEVSFKYSYATNGQEISQITERLRVLSSRDCGETWTPRQTINGAELVSAGSFGYSNFIPSNESQWRTASFVYNANSSDNKTRFKFEFTASDVSNNLYIDDIRINGILGVSNAEFVANVNLFPNPLKIGENLKVELNGNESAEFIQLFDLTGRSVARIAVEASDTIEIPTNQMNVSEGVYQVVLFNGSNVINRQSIVVVK